MTAIECKLIRQGGTFADIGGTEYHFAPQPDGAHVAQVADESHADRFLSIDGYRLYRSQVKAAPVAAPAIEPAPEVVTMLGSTEDAPTPPLSNDRDVLAAQYEELYGKPAHHKTSIHKLRELVAAKQTV